MNEQKFINTVSPELDKNDSEKNTDNKEGEEKNENVEKPEKKAEEYAEELKKETLERIKQGEEIYKALKEIGEEAVDKRLESFNHYDEMKNKDINFE
ncbi:MAG: hypothetical protein K9M44_02460 [Candidatus Pacebacteria bacterium]|nr:hypothetical protein [Candidatus Paceibacterota bacterium]